MIRIDFRPMLILTLVGLLGACGAGDIDEGSSSSSSSSSSSGSTHAPKPQTVVDAENLLDGIAQTNAQNVEGGIDGHFVRSLSHSLDAYSLDRSLDNLTNVGAYLTSAEDARVDHQKDVLAILADMPSTIEITPVARTTVDIASPVTGFHLVDSSFGAAAGRYRASRVVHLGHEGLISWTDDSAPVRSDLLRGAIRWLTEQAGTPYVCAQTSCEAVPLRIATFNSLSIHSGYALQADVVTPGQKLSTDDFSLLVVPNVWPTQAQYQTMIDFADKGGSLLVFGKVWQNDTVSTYGVELLSRYGLIVTKNWRAYAAVTYEFDKPNQTIKRGAETFRDVPSPLSAAVISQVTNEAQQVREIFPENHTLIDALDSLANLDPVAQTRAYWTQLGLVADLLASTTIDLVMPKSVMVDAQAYVVDWLLEDAWHAPSLMQYSINGGKSWMQTNSRPQVLPRTPLHNEQLQLRQRVYWPTLGTDLVGPAYKHDMFLTPPAIVDFNLRIDDPIARTPDDMGRTVWGRADGVGVDLVVVAESFLDSDRENFYQEALSAMNFMFGGSQPGIALHRNAWNIHFLFAVSNERGTDYVKETCDESTWRECSEVTVAASKEESRPDYFHDTKFHSGRFCMGNSTVSRLLCADSSAVNSYVQQYYPQADQVVVLVNSNVYGGAGGSVAVSSKNSLSVFVHELGHSFAGLADEYGGTDDSQQNRMFPAVLHNVTNKTDWQQVPWRHWIDVEPVCDDSSRNTMRCENSSNVIAGGGNYKIGYYEGGSYSDINIWRPTYNSLMRSTGPLYAVNTEIWAQHVYRVRGVFEPVFPLPNDYQPGSGGDSVEIHLQRGQAQRFLISPSFGLPQQQITWRLNGQTQMGFEGLAFEVPDTQVVSYELSVEVTDNTNSIRLDPENLSSRTFVWQVNLTDNPNMITRTAAFDMQAPSYKSTLVQLKWRGDLHQIQSVKHADVATKTSHFPFPHLDEIVYFEVQDVLGVTLLSGSQGIGKLIRAAGTVDGSFAKHQTSARGSGEYTLKFPYQAQAAALKLFDQQGREIARFSLR